MEEDLQSNMQNKCNQTYRQKKDNGNQTTIAKTGGLAIQLAKPHLKLHLNTNNNKENCKRKITCKNWSRVAINCNETSSRKQAAASRSLWPLSSLEPAQVDNAQGNQLLKFQLCEEWKRLTILVPAPPPAPSPPPLYNSGNHNGTLCSSLNLMYYHLFSAIYILIVFCSWYAQTFFSYLCA